MAISDYLNALDRDKQTLVENLNAQGVAADNSETFTTLAPKVLDIATGGGANAVLYVPQTLEDEQKQTARANIGAQEALTAGENIAIENGVISAQSGTAYAVQYVTQALTEGQQKTARLNIKAQSELTAGENVSLEENVISVPNVVLSAEQSLTDEQKATVRDNIGAQAKLLAGRYIEITNDKISVSGGGIVVVNDLPTGTAAEYNKHSLYLKNADLHFLIREETQGASSISVATEWAPSDTSTACACAVGTDAYVFTETNTIKYDMTADTYTTLSKRVIRLASAASVGSDVYIFGGGTSSYSYSTIERFDTLSQTTTTLSVTLTQRKYSTSACTVGNNIYIVGGAKSNYSSISRIERFDPAAQTCTALSATLGRGKTRVGVCALDTDMYIIGGFTTSPSSVVQKLDTTSNTITALTNLPTAKYNAKACAIGGNIYLFGGTTSSGSSVEILKYDVAAQSWSVLPEELLNTGIIGACEIGTDVYIFNETDVEKYLSGTVISYKYKKITSTEVVDETV